MSTPSDQPKPMPPVIAQPTPALTSPANDHACASTEPVGGTVPVAAPAGEHAAEVTAPSNFSTAIQRFPTVRFLADIFISTVIFMLLSALSLVMDLAPELLHLRAEQAPARQVFGASATIIAVCSLIFFVVYIGISFKTLIKSLIDSKS